MPSVQSSALMLSLDVDTHVATQVGIRILALEIELSRIGMTLVAIVIIEVILIFSHVDLPNFFVCYKQNSIVEMLEYNTGIKTVGE